MARGESVSRLGLGLRILREEGLRAVSNRTRDRREEKKRLKRLKRLTIGGDGALSIDFDAPPVLNLSPIPPSPKRGGSQIQMLDRLAVEKKGRTVALAYPRGASWWLEIWTDTHEGIFPLGSTSNVATRVLRAADLVGTGLIHLENAHGLPLNLIQELSRSGRRVILSVHDFTLFCRRPHLIEGDTGEFCGYCVDDQRCTACLRDIDLQDYPNQAVYRRAGSDAVASTAAVIYPSDFLRRQHRQLFTNLPTSMREVVIAPASARSKTAQGHCSGLPHVGFVGGAYAHKGAALIPQVMNLLSEKRPAVRGFVFGNGDSAFLRMLRSVDNLTIRGYYRQGHLARSLGRDEVALAVLPSIWPEAYGLVVDECLAAGVPVVAFDHGAVADRLASWEIGSLVPLEHGAPGLAESIFVSLAKRARVPDSIVEELPTPADTAAEHLALYRELQSQGKVSRAP